MKINKSYITKNTNNSIRIENNMLKFPKLGLLKTKFHRKYLKIIKYYLLLLVKYLELLILLVLQLNLKKK